MIRPFELRDLPILRRYRAKGLYLDSIPTLTWGRVLVPAGATFSFIAPATGVFTAIGNTEDNLKPPLLGQVVHTSGSTYAHIMYLAPEAALDSDALPDLLEHLITRVGERGAHNLLAEVDESAKIFEALRKRGFSIYARQRIWKVESPPSDQSAATGWRSGISRDEAAVRGLYNALVPALVQQVEPLPWARRRGLVYFQDGDLAAFADLASGPRGFWVQPFFHPDAERAPQLLVDLLLNIPYHPKRPAYVCVRSYQSWLEPALEDLEAEAGPRQAVMVKRLAVAVQKPALAPLPNIKGSTAKPSAPFTSLPDPNEIPNGVAQTSQDQP